MRLSTTPAGVSAKTRSPRSATWRETLKPPRRGGVGLLVSLAAAVAASLLLVGPAAAAPPGSFTEMQDDDAVALLGAGGGQGVLMLDIEDLGITDAWGADTNAYWYGCAATINRTSYVGTVTYSWGGQWFDEACTINFTVPAGTRRLSATFNGTMYESADWSCAPYPGTCYWDHGDYHPDISASVHGRLATKVDSSGSANTVFDPKSGYMKLQWCSATDKCYVTGF